MSSLYEGPVPPLGRRSISPDATAPDGSEIRLLATSDNGATKSSLVEVALDAGQLHARFSIARWKRSGTCWKGPAKFGAARLMGDQQPFLPQTCGPVILWSYPLAGPSSSKPALKARCGFYATPPRLGQVSMKPCLSSTEG